MKRVFLCHSSADKPFVLRLADELKKLKLDVWLDVEQVRIGDVLLNRLSDAIREADYVAAVISRNSATSNWVDKELQMAMAREVERGKVVVLPIVIDDVVLPPFLADKVYADFRNPHAFESSYERLLRTLGVDADDMLGLSDGMSYEEMFSDSNEFELSLEAPPVRPLREKLKSRRHRVLIFWHEAELTLGHAIHMTSHLSESGILANFLKHKDNLPADSVFVAHGTHPDLTARVFSSLPYTPRFIYPFSFASPECGSASDYSVSVGLHATQYLANDPKWPARPLREEDFRVLAAERVSEDYRVNLLRRLAGDGT